MKKENLKIVFMGTSGFAKDILASLVEDKYKILATFTQPDKKVGRSHELKPSPVKEFSDLHKIPLFQPKRIDQETITKIKEIDPNLIIVTAYGKIIPKELLEIPKFKCINVHPSMLPKFRGPSPIQNAILSGEKEAGITIMLMDEKVDHGNILSQIKFQIEPEDTTETLTEKIIPLSSKILSETILGWIEGKIKPQEQDDSKATYCQLIEREDGHIFWNEEAEIIYNKFRAFHPWPEVFFLWTNNGSLIRIKIKKMRIQKEGQSEKRKIGEVFKINEEIGVQAVNGIIMPEEIQLEGKKPLKIKEFINGYPNFIGSILK